MKEKIQVLVQMVMSEYVVSGVAHVLNVLVW